MKNREPQPPVCEKGRPKAAFQVQTMQVRKYVVPLPQTEGIVSASAQERGRCLRQASAENNFFSLLPPKGALTGVSPPGNVPVE